MRAKHVFRTVDTHTAGQPTRTVVSGLPPIPGKTMEEKLLYAKEKYDWVRTLLMCEPRGSNVMSGAILTEPCSPGTDVGVLYMEVGGWMPMCGHDTIGVGTALVECGMVKVAEPYTELKLDTAAGVVTLKIKVSGQKAETVSFVNAPAFMLRSQETVDTKEYGKVTVDIGYGGNFYAIVDVQAVGLDLKRENYRSLIDAGNLLKTYINEQLPVVHPEKPFINETNHIEFIGPSDTPGVYNKDAVVFPPGDIDRSPCGTGTSARCAQLVAEGKLRVGESFVHESFIGSLFRCKAVKETEVAGIPAVIPEVTGSAYMMGMSTFFLDPDDPFPIGFQLS